MMDIIRDTTPNEGEQNLDYIGWCMCVGKGPQGAL